MWQVLGIDPDLCSNQGLCEFQRWPRCSLGLVRADPPAKPAGRRGSFTDYTFSSTAVLQKENSSKIPGRRLKSCVLSAWARKTCHLTEHPQYLCLVLLYKLLNKSIGYTRCVGLEYKTFSTKSKTVQIKGRTDLRAVNVFISPHRQLSLPVSALRPAGHWCWFWFWRYKHGILR